MNKTTSGRREIASTDRLTGKKGSRVLEPGLLRLRSHCTCISLSFSLSLSLSLSLSPFLPFSFFLTLIGTADYSWSLSLDPLFLSFSPLTDSSNPLIGVSE